MPCGVHEDNEDIGRRTENKPTSSTRYVTVNTVFNLYAVNFGKREFDSRRSRSDAMLNSTPDILHKQTIFCDNCSSASIKKSSVF